MTNNLTHHICLFSLSLSISTQLNLTQLNLTWLNLTDLPVTNKHKQVLLSTINKAVEFEDSLLEDKTPILGDIHLDRQAKHVYVATPYKVSTLLYTYTSVVLFVFVVILYYSSTRSIAFGSIHF